MLCSIVTTHPSFVTVPTPVEVTPLQQNRYAPVSVLYNTTMFGSLSSCKHPSNTVTVKLQTAVLPPTSVAVQVTVVVPTGNTDWLAGEQNVMTFGVQLSEAVAV